MELGPVYREVRRVSESEFLGMTRHERALEPLVLTDISRTWPALTKWTPDFFKEEYGDRAVPTYDKAFAEPSSSYLSASGSMSFGQYIELIESSPTDTRLFLFELFRMAPELRRDIELPSWLGPLSKIFLVTFFGGEGGLTTFHYDVDLPNVFHAVLFGKKEFRLFSQDQSRHLYAHPWTVRSYVNTKKPNLTEHPSFANASGFACEVEAGETLFIPTEFWHQVYYPGASWGIAFRQYPLRKIPRALFNMLVQESVDRMLTKAAPKRWFAWKRKAAGER